MTEALRGHATRSTGTTPAVEEDADTETMGDASDIELDDTELDAEPPRLTANPPAPTALELAELLLTKAYNDRVKDDDVTVLVSILGPTS